MTGAAIAQHFAAADAARGRGDMAATVRALEAVLAIDPNEARALNSLAMIVQRQGDSTRALDLLTRATIADPNAPQLWLNRALAEAQAGREEAQRASLTAALAVDAAFLPARLLRGALDEKAGNAADAFSDYALALALVPPGADLPAGLAPLFERAQAMIKAHNLALAERLDADLAAAGPLPGRFQRMVEVMTGRSQVYRSQPAVMDYPELPAIEYFDRALFPWFAELEAATAVIREEYQALAAADSDGAEPYVAYQPGEPVNQWAELNHNKRWGARFFMRDGVLRPEMAKACPRTTEIIERLPLFNLKGRGPAAFFSVLAPRTRIPPHTGATNMRAIVHLPLIVPPGCAFRVGGTTRPWIPGEAFAFDDTIEHEAWNDSDMPRAILIIDTWNPAIPPAEQALIAQLIAGIDAQRKAGKTWADM